MLAREALCSIPSATATPAKVVERRCHVMNRAQQLVATIVIICCTTRIVVGVVVVDVVMAALELDGMWCW